MLLCCGFLVLLPSSVEGHSWGEKARGPLLNHEVETWIINMGGSWAGWDHSGTKGVKHPGKGDSFSLRFPLLPLNLILVFSFSLSLSFFLCCSGMSSPDLLGSCFTWMTLLAPTPWTPQSTRPQGHWSDSCFSPKGNWNSILFFFLAGASFFPVFYTSYWGWDSLLAGFVYVSE